MLFKGFFHVVPEFAVVKWKDPCAGAGVFSCGF